MFQCPVIDTAAPSRCHRVSALYTLFWVGQPARFSPLLTITISTNSLQTKGETRNGVWGNAPCKLRPRHSWSECGGPHGFRKYPVLLVGRPGGDCSWLALIARTWSISSRGIRVLKALLFFHAFSKVL